MKNCDSLEKSEIGHFQEIGEKNHFSYTKIVLKSKRIDRFYRIKAHLKALIQPVKMILYTSKLVEWLLKKGGGHRGVPLC